jgi:hypothetical protein
MARNKFFFGLGSFSIKDGSEIRFWKDKWLGNATLREQYPALYSIVHPPSVAFRRDFSGQRLIAWNALLLCLANIQL